MKRSLVFVVLFSTTVAFAAETTKSVKNSPYDVVAPGLNGNPAGSDRQAGQIYLDVTSGTGGSLKVIGTDGNIQALSTGSGSAVSSDGSAERIERATFGGANDVTACSSSPCTIHRQSGAWLTSVVRNGTGDYTLNIVNGMFSAPPVCIFYSRYSTTTIFPASANTSTSYNFKNFNTNTSTYVDTAMDLICMGPK